MDPSPMTWHVRCESPAFREAFERVRGELEQVPDGSLLPIQLEVGAAVGAVLSRAPRLSALRAQIVATIPSFDVARYDRLLDYAMATWHAQTLYRSATENWTKHRAYSLLLRAYALFARAYDEVRRVVTYLRWHERDADQIAPCLYTLTSAPPPPPVATVRQLRALPANEL